MIQPQTGAKENPPERSQLLLAQALSDSVEALVQTLRLDEVLDRILENVGRVVAHDAVDLMLLDEGEVTLVRSSGYSEQGRDAYPMNLRIPLAQAPNLMEIAGSGLPLVIANTQSYPGWVDVPQTRWIRSYVGAPIHSQGEIFGFLNLVSAQVDAFTPEDARRLHLFAAQAAVAIRNARLFESSQRSAEQAALINEITSALNRPIEVPGILQTAVDRLAEALHVAYVGVALLDEAGQKLHFVADHAVDVYTSMVGMELEVTTNWVAEEPDSERKIVRVTDILGEPHSGVSVNFQVERQAAALLAIPLVLHGQIIGVLGCATLRERQEFTPDEIRLLETVANLAAVRVEQARLLGDARLRAVELAALYDTALEISRQHGLTSVLQKITESSVALLKADGGKLFLCNESQQEVRCVTSCRAPDGQLNEVLHYGEGAAGKVAQTGQSLLVNNYATWPGRARLFEALWKPASLLSVPMLWQDRVTGVIQVFRSQSQDSFHQADQDLLVLFASQAATALENSRLYEKLQHQAITDELTGVYNRRGLFELGRRDLERSRRYGRLLSVILFDIDHFKQVNDRFGHAVGDQVLAAVGKTCVGSVREVDIVGRYGGEEFVMLLPEAELPVAQQVAERIRKLVEQICVPTTLGEDARVTISIGVTEMQESDNELDTLLSRADNAMYAAKQAGRNRVMVF